MLSGLGITDPVLSLFAAAVPDEMIDFRIRIDSPEDVRVECEELGPGIDIRPLGFVPIGSTHCGDVYALDYHSPPHADGTPRVLLVSHERGYESAAAVLEHTEERGGSLIEFLEWAATGEGD